MNNKMNLLKKYYGKVIIASGVLFLAIFGLTACESETDGGPLGPSSVTSSSSLVTVIPAALTVVKGGTLTFTASGGTGAFTWSVSNPTLASIVLNSGAFTAGTTNGSVTVTATDQNGSSGTATVTISDKSLTILPSTAQVGKQGTQTFTVTGGTGPIFFSVDNATIGSMPSNDGADPLDVQSTFTAGITAGTLTITAVDSDGDTLTASVTVVSNTVTLTPASVTLPNTAAGVTVFTTGGSVGDIPTFSFAISGQSNSYTGAVATPTAGTADVAATVSIATAVPTLAEGDQTLTITATDSNGDSATSQLTLAASLT
jgi:large repetitive protein